jgi:hypothetical protein
MARHLLSISGLTRGRARALERKRRTRDVKSGTLAGTVLILGIALLACGKKETYSPSCKKEAEMTAPWTGLKLPVDDGRVCSSSSNRLEVQFTKGTREEWFGAFETAVTTAGFVKKNCSSMSCSYQRGPERVQIVGLDAQKWKTIVLHM